MSGAEVESAVEQLRADEELARRTVTEGAPALAAFDLTDEEASALVEALRLDVGDSFDEVSGFAMPGGLPLTNLIGVGRQFGVHDLSGRGGDWSSHGLGQEGWIERPGAGGMAT